MLVSIELSMDAFISTAECGCLYQQSWVWMLASVELSVDARLESAVLAACVHEIFWCKWNRSVRPFLKPIICLLSKRNSTQSMEIFQNCKKFECLLQLLFYGWWILYITRLHGLTLQQTSLFGMKKRAKRLIMANKSVMLYSNTAGFRKRTSVSF